MTRLREKLEERKANEDLRAWVKKRKQYIKKHPRKVCKHSRRKTYKKSIVKKPITQVVAKKRKTLRLRQPHWNTYMYDRGERLEGYDSSCRYTGFCTRGFPRSGNCYSTFLIGSNFFGHTKQASCISHRLEGIRKPNTAIFYIRRNFISMADSLYRFRQRFSFGDCTFAEFLERRLCDLPRIKNPIVSVEDKIATRRYVRTSNRHFIHSQRTLRALWEEHIAWGERMAKRRPAVYIVDYDLIWSDFHGQMLLIAKHLGSNKREFQDIETRVGHYPASEEGKWVRK